MDTTSPDLVPTSDVARRLGCSLPTVRRLLADGKLSGIRDGRLIRVRRTSVEDYLKRNATGGDSRV